MGLGFGLRTLGIAVHFGIAVHCRARRRRERGGSRQDAMEISSRD